jgi:hypothetical protein
VPSAPRPVPTSNVAPNTGCARKRS